MLTRTSLKLLKCPRAICRNHSTPWIKTSSSVMKISPKFRSFCNSTDDHNTNVTFEQMGISSSRLQYLKKFGMEKMFPVQEATFKPIREGKDIIARAKTGTGKTIAFALPLIERYGNERGERNSPRILILAPTRELAVQVTNEVEKLDPRLSTVTVFGGASVTMQSRQLSFPVDVVVGTPGRVIHFIDDGTLLLSNVRAFVLDEADQMLDIGFKKAIEIIMEQMPQEKQTLLFSATIPPWIKNVARNYMKLPRVIDLVGDRKTPDKVTHYSIEVSGDSQRFVALSLLVQQNRSKKMLIFVETKLECSKIASGSLSKYTSMRALHGDISQAERQRTLDEFRSGEVMALVATDVAARGLDIPGVDMVINYRPPSKIESYIHRSGRGGRAGKVGESIVLFSQNENFSLRIIEKNTGTPFQPKELTPSKDSVNVEKEKKKFEDSLASLFNTKLDYCTTWSNELCEKFGSAEKVLPVVLKYLQTKKSDTFSLITGTSGVVTMAAIPKAGSSLSKIKLSEILGEKDLSNVAIYETKNRQLIFDVPSENASDLTSDDIVDFEPVGIFPVLAGERKQGGFGNDDSRDRRNSFSSRDRNSSRDRFSRNRDDRPRERFFRGRDDRSRERFRGRDDRDDRGGDSKFPSRGRRDFGNRKNSFDFLFDD